MNQLQRKHGEMQSKANTLTQNENFTLL